MFNLTLAKELCRHFEGFRSKPYLCPAGIPTIGYGATYYADGRAVTLDDPPISEAEAANILNQQLTSVYLPGVLRQCPNLILRGAVLNAIVDFAFNLGLGRLQTSTLRRKLREENWPEARAELGKWVRGGGKVLPGLVKRRAAEAALLPM